MEALERVDVLHLGLRAELRLSAAPEGDVAVAAHGAGLERAVGDAERAERLLELLHEEAGLFRSPEVGLRDKLDQGRAAAVVVDE